MPDVNISGLLVLEENCFLEEFWLRRTKCIKRKEGQQSSKKSLALVVLFLSLGCRSQERSWPVQLRMVSGRERSELVAVRRARTIALSALISRLRRRRQTHSLYYYRRTEHLWLGPRKSQLTTRGGNALSGRLLRYPYYAGRVVSVRPASRWLRAAAHQPLEQPFSATCCSSAVAAAAATTTADFHRATIVVIRVH